MPKPTDIADFIDAVYNQKRLHSSLEYRPPVEFENDFYADQDASRQASQNKQQINQLPNKLP